MGDLRRTARNLVAIGRPKAERAEYEITFFVEELGASTRAQNELLDLIYRHLAAAGIDLALPPNELWRPAEVAAVRSRTRPERVLELVDVFRLLTAAERAAIAAKLQPRYPLIHSAPPPKTHRPRRAESCESGFVRWVDFSRPGAELVPGFHQRLHGLSETAASALSFCPGAFSDKLAAAPRPFRRHLRTAVDRPETTVRATPTPRRLDSAIMSLERVCMCA